MPVGKIFCLPYGKIVTGPSCIPSGIAPGSHYRVAIMNGMHPSKMSRHGMDDMNADGEAAGSKGAWSIRDVRLAGPVHDVSAAMGFVSVGF
ncbi:hypothetical protein CFR71_10205 [Novacetimonas pomaceti]|uniref:Uncharacterized protein n=1 Tax=Novacetimonas pomaceti TaxID=2021998 RepID=A0A318Q8U8_9PROT|nr:hypothetical protein CFR71_10205 [Novacetimonas pomaceti]